MKRDVYIAAQLLIAAARAADAGFCSVENEEEWSVDDLDLLKADVASSCSRNQLENAITVIEGALKLKPGTTASSSGELGVVVKDGALHIPGDPTCYSSVELGVDGDAAFALLGPNLQEGEAEFVKLDGLLGRSVNSGALAAAAAQQAHSNLCKRLGYLFPYHYGKSHPMYLP